MVKKIKPPPKHACYGNPKYRVEMCERVPALYKNGESDVEVAFALDISKQTFYEWVREKPEFAAAVAKGKAASECWWQKLGRAGAAGKVKVQPTIWFANMKNRFQWSDNVTVDSSTEMRQTVRDLKAITDKIKAHEREY